MFDQGFSLVNFRRVYDLEMRKGRNIDERFKSASDDFAHLQSLSYDIKNKTSKLKRLFRSKKIYNSEVLRDFISETKKSISSIRELKSAFIDDTLTTIISEIEKGGHIISLIEKEGPSGKPVYDIDGDPKSFFIVKQIQHNLQHAYNVKQSNRSTIVRQLKSLLDGSYPVVGIRTDISDFYESIDSAKLLNLIAKDQKLSLESVRYIKQILSSYYSLSGKNSGLPRGVGISAYLSELYMAEIDRQIKSMPNVIFYARYVDDIIAIFSYNHTTSYSIIHNTISEMLKTLGLSLNAKKTSPLTNATMSTTVFGPSLPNTFSFIGYEFEIGNKVCEIGIEESRLEKYKFRLDRSFDSYEKHKIRNKSESSKILYNRVKFLTSNTKLNNSKKNAMVGIYHSNKEITRFDQLDILDGHLNMLRRKIKRNSGLVKRLKQYGFKKGFQEQIFYKYNIKEISAIIKVWRYEK